MDIQTLTQALTQARVYDLAQPYAVGMPHYPTHPPFLFSLTKKHGDIVSETGVSAAADSIALGTHVGTHIDALCHFSCNGRLYGGVDAASVQSYGAGLGHLSVDTVAPLIRRGVLLDIAGHLGIDTLPADTAITPELLESAAASQQVEVRAGDVVLLRTGWARYWDDPVRYTTGGSGNQACSPGPELAAARWLSSRGVFAAGSDTLAFERVPSGMQVHVHLLVENGIHIIEVLNMEELARDRVYEFAFLAAPMKIKGGTGSPVRPLALA